ncbi:MAG: polysaccharide pyruvyl transferase family protein [Lachnospiraceae bacterium]|jgi:hypothetical protein|nr:polysaccharide pyruvyl transferase family protein [Lachnospiraceae bacterium]
MKIGIITFHFAENYGAVLQCYALQQYFANLECPVEIINYRPDYHTVEYAAFLSPYKRFKKDLYKNREYKGSDKMKRIVKGQLLNLRDLFYRDKIRKKRQAFLDFEAQYLKETREYKTLEEIQRNPPECDAYISGSDQLWNPKLTNDQLDRAYFLDFGDLAVKRLTYAVSACQLDVNKYRKQLKKLLSNLDGISLREDRKRADLSKIYDGDIVCNIDPTLLHKKELYDEIRTKEKQETDYLLLLLFSKESQRKLNKVLAGITAELQVKPLIFHPTVSRMKWDVPVITPVGVGPSEYISYIANAKYIITDSFHCTAFSIIYKKEFITLPLKGRGERMIELLSGLQLEDRIANTEEDLLKLIHRKLDYSRTDELLEAAKEKTDHYFKKYL